MTKPIIKKNTLLIQAIKNSDFKISAIRIRADVPKGRFYRLCNGAKPYLHEAKRLAGVLQLPINSLFQEVK